MEPVEFEAEIQALMDEAQEKRQKFLQRIVSAQQGIEAIDQEIAAYAMTLNNWRQRHGIERSIAIPARDLEIVNDLRQLSTRGMLLYWADEHDGKLVVNDMVKAVTSASLFQDKEQAAATLYATLGRSAEWFEKLGRGRYHRLLAPAPSEPEDNWSDMPPELEEEPSEEEVSDGPTPEDEAYAFLARREEEAELVS